ncbi:MAG: hypothetical protein IAE85_01155 [Anaerolinea sp.]|nr:hypothetical protein [Anaerolinea sp.]
MTWHKAVIAKLEASGIFESVSIIGGKVRASIDEVRFLDIHFDPKMRSYSYALIDLTVLYPGDKRIFGWDDFPHEGVAEFKQLATHPHHFQRRASDGTWIFEPSSMRGDVTSEMDLVMAAVEQYLDRFSHDMEP